MTDVVGPGSLQLIIGCSSERSVRDVIRDALRNHVAGSNIRTLGDETLIVYTNELPAALRDHLRPFLAEDESLLIVEFERWSSCGPAVDSRWLLRRGH